MAAKRAANSVKYHESVSLLFRLEYFILTITIVGMIYWSDISSRTAINTLQLVAMFILPDLFSFIPLSLIYKKRQWPDWAITLYNILHSVVTWCFVFIDLWIITGGPYMPMLGWLLHIAVDRMFGYTLRKH